MSPFPQRVPINEYVTSSSTPSRILEALTEYQMSYSGGSHGMAHMARMLENLNLAPEQ